ncbi:MAG: hypothetical protein J0I12_29185 [Candidatus Eremiobacteraeota bacterium]|nr:hypothetical protein [Candidatus Eremiobacteraeota bacterium]
MSERSNLAEPLLAKAEAGELSSQQLDAVRVQLDSAQRQLSQELEAASQDLPELEAQLADGVGDAFCLMHYALDELRNFLESGHPGPLRLARLLFEKGEEEYAGLRGRLKRIEMHATSSDLPGSLWTRVLEQSQRSDEEDFDWAMAEFSAHLQHFGLAFEEALQLVDSDAEEAGRRVELLRLRLAQLLT